MVLHWYFFNMKEVVQKIREWLIYETTATNKISLLRNRWQIRKGSICYFTQYHLSPFRSDTEIDGWLVTRWYHMILPYCFPMFNGGDNPLYSTGKRSTSEPFWNEFIWYTTLFPFLKIVMMVICKTHWRFCKLNYKPP